MQSTHGRVLRTLQHGVELSGLAATELLEVARLVCQERVVDHGFFKQLSTHLVPIIHTCTPRELAEFATIFNRMKETDTLVFSRIVDRVLPKMGEASNGDLARIFRALAMANFHDQRYFLAFASQFLRRTRTEQWTLQNLRYVIEALSKLNLLQKRLLQRWIKQTLAATAAEPELDPWTVASFAHSINLLGFWSPSLMRTLRQAQYRTPPETLTDMSRSTFLSYSFLGLTDGNFLQFILRRATSRDPTFRELHAKEWARFRIALYACYLDNDIDLHGASLGVLRDLGCRFQQLVKRREEASSGLMEEVKIALKDATEQTAEAEQEAGPYLIDMVI
eukprot:GEMP01054858.1.p1 GENE.GEMP01054858.1~~GEMP01054858.1.p1  ORF type:complete len:335 (+),score=67.23 GEMP01054858.1:27-1031(+)